MDDHVPGPPKLSAWGVLILVLACLAVVGIVYSVFRVALEVPR